MKRRRFLKSSGLAGSSLLILPTSGLYGQERKSARTLQVGFIGMGGQIQGHVSQIAELGHHVAALCDVDAQQLTKSQQRHGAATAKASCHEWVDACLGGPPVFSNFDAGGHLTEIGLAGIVALRLQKNIHWDGPNRQAPGTPEADRFIRKENRTAYL